MRLCFEARLGILQHPPSKLQGVQLGSVFNRLLRPAKHVGRCDRWR